LKIIEIILEWKRGDFLFMQNAFHKGINFNTKFNDRDFCILKFR